MYDTILVALVTWDHNFGNHSGLYSMTQDPLQTFREQWWGLSTAPYLIPDWMAAAGSRFQCKPR